MSSRRPVSRSAGVLAVAVVLVVLGAGVGARAVLGPGGLLADVRARDWTPDLHPEDDRATAVLAATLERLPGVVDVEVLDADLGTIEVTVDPGDPDAPRRVEDVCRDAEPQWGGWFDPDDQGASCRVLEAAG